MNPSSWVSNHLIILTNYNKLIEYCGMATGVVMTCVIGLGYFQELGQFNSHVYKNNELSQMLRETHPSNLGKLIGLL